MSEHVYCLTEGAILGVGVNIKETEHRNKTEEVMSSNGKRQGSAKELG